LKEAGAGFTASTLTFGSFCIFGSLKAAIVDILEVMLCKEWPEDRTADEETLEQMDCEESRLRKALNMFQECCTVIFTALARDLFDYLTRPNQDAQRAFHIILRLQTASGGDISAARGTKAPRHPLVLAKNK
jgi:hypothetical protein